jgi:type 1 glutamine amidotransferase
MIQICLSVLRLRWLVALLALAPLIFVTRLAVGAEASPLKICLLSASAEYDSDKSLAGFQKHLESHYRVVCQMVYGKDKGEGLQGLEALDSTDLMIVFTRRITLPATQLKLVEKYLVSGRPVIGIRTASHAFSNYLEFDRDILGGGYQGHYGDERGSVQLSPGRGAHPVLAGVTNFNSFRLYKNPTLADDVVVLLEGTTGVNREPLAWVRELKGARVFYTSLGTQEDFTQESFRRLLVNAIFWTTRRDQAVLRRPADSAKQGTPTQN